MFFPAPYIHAAATGLCIMLVESSPLSHVTFNIIPPYSALITFNIEYTHIYYTNTQTNFRIRHTNKEYIFSFDISDHTPPPSVEVKKELCYTSTHPTGPPGPVTGFHLPFRHKHVPHRISTGIRVHHKDNLHSVCSCDSY